MFGLSNSSSSKQSRPKFNGPDIASMTSPGPKYEDIRRHNEQAPPPTQSHQPTSRVTYNPIASGPVTRSAAGLKWGVTPKDEPPPYSPAESSYSEGGQAERARLRAKGINPDLKAEVDEIVYGNGKERKKKKSRFWSKVAGTSIGGGGIK